MIPFDFVYYKPTNLDETISLYNRLLNEGKRPLYYGGGTEIISLARAFEICTDALIDIKGLKECQVYEVRNNELVIGAAVSLTQISEGNLFPLLTQTAKRISDHTNQGKITLGGNLAGTIIYNETALPLLLSDCDVLIAGLNGYKTVQIGKLFDRGIKLTVGDLIVQVKIPVKYLSLPFIHVKRTKNGKIQYPLLSACALLDNNEIKIAFSGLCEYSFRKIEIEKLINQQNFNIDEVFHNILEVLPGPVINNLDGSKEFRQFMFKSVLIETVSNLRGEENVGN